MRSGQAHVQGLNSGFPKNGRYQIVEEQQQLRACANRASGSAAERYDCLRGKLPGHRDDHVQSRLYLGFFEGYDASPENPNVKSRL
jgi:hypothetical protein